MVVLGGTWAISWYFGLEQRSTRPSIDTRGSSTQASVLIDFGNGTSLWYNKTGVPVNYNYYNLTYEVTNHKLVAVWSPYLQSSFVFKILGVGCNAGDYSCGKGQYWSLWVWNTTNDCWQQSDEGVDRIEVSTTRMIAWYFTDEPSSFKMRC